MTWKTVALDIRMSCYSRDVSCAMICAHTENMLWWRETKELWRQLPTCLELRRQSHFCHLLQEVGVLQERCLKRCAAGMLSEAVCCGLTTVPGLEMLTQPLWTWCCSKGKGAIQHPVKWIQRFISIVLETGMCPRGAGWTRLVPNEFSPTWRK